ncbi:MAG: hypothetical protein ACREJD_09450 [Phycisphaerales bacterium]
MSPATAIDPTVADSNSKAMNQAAADPKPVSQLVASAGVSRSDTMSVGTARPIPVRKTVFYNLLDMKNLPPESELGLSRIVEDGRSWWPQLSSDPQSKRIIDLDASRAHAAKLDDNVPTTVDFEDAWDDTLGKVRPLRLDIRFNTSREVAADVSLVRQVLRSKREGGFTGKLGAYGVMPISEVNWNILTRDPRYPIEQRLWRTACRFTALDLGLIEEVDFVDVSLYAIGPDVNQHIEWCEATIDVAKSFGKPVIAHISPESHWNASGGFARTLLSQPQWQATLELIRRKEIDAALWIGGDNNFKHDFATCPMWWQVFEALRDKWAAEAIRQR